MRIAQLRRALGPARRRLETAVGGYVFRVAPGELDLDRFSALVDEARGLAPTDAADLLRTALSLWRGAPLGDLGTEPFARGICARLEELRLATLEQRIELDLELGRHAELVSELEELVVRYPLREHLCAQLMLALYRSGRQAEALQLYRTTREGLVRELGIEPSARVRELEAAILRHDPTLDVAVPAAPTHSILVALRDPARLDALLALAEGLARMPPREIVVLRSVPSTAELPAAASLVAETRKRLTARGLPARSAAFVSAATGEDLARLASAQDPDLLLLDGASGALQEGELSLVLDRAACDVAVLAGGSPRAGSILVPFVGADHDWSAVELAASLAASTGSPLVIAGTTGDPASGGRDASRLLANASLAVQRALGVAPEPLLVEPAADALLPAAATAGVIVIGLSDRWPRDGLGTVRLALAETKGPARVLVRRGVRPGGLAAEEDLSRFTWSVG